jgi:hypothetical protein
VPCNDDYVAVGGPSDSYYSSGGRGNSRNGGSNGAADFAGFDDGTDGGTVFIIYGR